MVVSARRAALDAEPREILRVVGELRPGATMCPGELAKRLGTTQTALRPLLLELAAAGRVSIRRRGAEADLATLRGPYRVAPARR